MYVFLYVSYGCFLPLFLLRLFNMEILIVIGVIFVIFYLIFLKKTKVKLNDRFIAHEWISLITDLPKDE